MDTKYFLEALARYSKDNPWSTNLPLTPSALSEILQEAQKLKEADKKKESEPEVIVTVPTPKPEK